MSFCRTSVAARRVLQVIQSLQTNLCSLGRGPGGLHPRSMGARLMSHFPPKPAGVRHWRIAGLLGLGVLVNYFDRVNLSVAHDALITSFGISTIAFGYLSGAYNWTYALCQLPVGVLLDRFGVRRVGRWSTLVQGQSL